MEPLDHARGEEHRVEVALEALLDAGAQHLDRDRLERAVGSRILALWTCAIEAAATGGTELGEQRIDRRI